MIVILGGGLAGMSAAYHLARVLPGVERVVLEREEEAGGLCRSRRVEGFTFDFTGHYLHLRDPEMIAWVDELVGDELVEVERKARIHAHGARLHFPYQANLHGLPPALVAQALIDFVEASKGEEPSRDGRMPFGQWARQVFGATIAESFLIPYNTKLFGVEADEITAEWVAWAVPRPSLEQVVRGALGVPSEGLGYNPRFRYPRGGGIGVLPDALAREVEGDLRLGTEIVAIDAAARRVRLASGEELAYEKLVSTAPLPRLLAMVGDAAGREFGGISDGLRASAVVELALGVERAEIAEGAHWIYFPEPEYPFYRIGFPSNVCSKMAPEGCSSLSIEFCHRAGAPLPERDALLATARAGLERAGILAPGDRVRVADIALLDPAYVLFDPPCSALVDGALAALAELGIYSIGRFGAWTYSYMERALLDGRDAARSIATELGR